MSNAARAVAKLLAPNPVGLPPVGHWHQGVVTVVATGPPPTVTVAIGGSATATAGLRYMTSYVPAVGDTVWLLRIGTDNIVFGPLRGTAGNSPVTVRSSFSSGVDNATTSGSVVAIGAGLSATVVVPPSGQVAVTGSIVWFASGFTDAALYVQVGAGAWQQIIAFPFQSASLYQQSIGTVVLTGLTPGSTTFALGFSVTGGATLTIPGFSRGAAAAATYIQVTTQP